MALEHRQEPIAVRGSSRFGLWDDDVGMRLEQADDFLVGGHRLAMKTRRSVCAMIRSISGR
jgi:hypothetical protein